MGTGTPVSPGEEITAEKMNLKLETVETTDIVEKAVTTSKIGSNLVQGGSAQSGNYFVYPVSYSTIKGAVCVPMNSFNQGTYPVYITNLTAGSCVPHGSPGGYLQVIVVGDR